jgi:hypothetical protein
MSLGPLTGTLERTHANRMDIDTRPRRSIAKSPKIAASHRRKPA